MQRQTLLHNAASLYQGNVPPALRPAMRAYALGYLTVTGPRLFGFLRVVVKKDIDLARKVAILYNILRTSTQVNRFPTSCAIIIGGASAVPRLIKSLIEWLLRSVQGKTARNLGPKALERIRFITTFLSAWTAFNLLNRDQEWARKRRRSVNARQETGILDYPNQHHLPPPDSKVQWAGKTIDLTLFALCRALDTSVLQLWNNTLTSVRHPLTRWPELGKLMQTLADPAVFTTSTAVIMHSWFYKPERLPKSYNRWISTAANIDPRLISVLRLARTGDWVYGQDTGQAGLVGGMATELGLPEAAGDPRLTIPLPCEIVHSGTGPSCEYHALSRWVRSFLFAMQLYLPLQFLTHVRALVKTPYHIQRVRIAYAILRGSSRSSTFLATFIALFYYTVCLTRTRLPQLYCHTVNSDLVARAKNHFTTTTATRSDSRSKYSYYKSISTAVRQRIDGGLCVLAGCMTCGLAIFTEKPGRRAEFGQFVAPRAVATLMPRVYDARHLWKERVVFAASVAVVLGGIGEGKKDVRGVLGRVLAQVLKETT